MSRFHYVARMGGYETRGVIEADSKRSAIRLLTKQGFDRVRVKPVRDTPRRFLN